MGLPAQRLILGQQFREPTDSGQRSVYLMGYSCNNGSHGRQPIGRPQHILRPLPLGYILGYSGNTIDLPAFITDWEASIPNPPY